MTLFILFRMLKPNISIYFSTVSLFQTALFRTIQKTYDYSLLKNDSKFETPKIWMPTIIASRLILESNYFKILSIYLNRFKTRDLKNRSKNYTSIYIYLKS